MTSKFGGVAVDEPRQTNSKFGGIAVDDLAGDTTVAEPTVSQKAGSFARGLGKSIVGGYGDIQEMGSDVSNYLAQKVLPTNAYETYKKIPTASELMYGRLPRSKDVEKGIQTVEKSVGVKPGITPGTEGYEFGGEIAPAVAGGAKALYSGLKYAAGKISTARGTELEKALGTIGTSAETLASKASSAFKQAEDFAKEKLSKFGRAEVTLREQAKEKLEKSAREFSGLGNPKDPAYLGDEMQRTLVGREKRLESNVARQAKQDFGDYFKQAVDFDVSSARAEMIGRLQALSESPSAGSVGREFASKALRDLEKSTDALGAEKEFRKYFQEASAPQQVGFGAEQQQANRVVSDIISNALDKHAPKRIEARQTYKEYKTPLDAYETLFGKRGVAIEKNVQDKLKMMPSDYPNYYFKNRDTINVLRDQLGMDEAAVRKFANQHTVNELTGKSANEAKTWLQNNSGWLNTVEGLNQRVNKYVINLEQNEAKAAAMQKGAKTLTSRRETKELDLSKLSTENKKFVADSVSEIKTSMQSNPAAVPTSAKKYINGLYEKGVITRPEWEQYTTEVNQAIKAAKDQKEATSLIVKALVGLGVGGGTAGYFSKNLLGSP